MVHSNFWPIIFGIIVSLVCINFEVKFRNHMLLLFLLLMLLLHLLVLCTVQRLLSS